MHSYTIHGNFASLRYSDLVPLSYEMGCIFSYLDFDGFHDLQSKTHQLRQTSDHPRTRLSCYEVKVRCTCVGLGMRMCAQHESRAE